MSARRDALVSAQYGPAPAPADWRDRARCRDLDGELFFPLGTTPAAVAQEHAAKSVCLLCPVREPCLAWAMARPIQAGWGVWGGLSEEERRALRKGQRRRRRAV